MIPIDLTGRVALVTGGGAGMGEATAHAFAKAGAAVLVADRDESSAQAVAEVIVADGGTASAVLADVSREADVAAMVAAAAERYGHLDCAVNNAAVTPDTRPLVEMEEADLDRVIGVNLKGVALCLKHELRQMRSQGTGGAIVNIGSTSSLRPQPNGPAYVAAKHGVIGLTKAAAIESAADGVRVNTVCPGATDTPMIRASMERRGMTEADFAPILSLFGRFAHPGEIANASLWLCSDHASYVTGATLSVDAGYAAR
jgi:glucose 1-dehydrogenase